jgi:hypothetical protein
MRAKNTHDTNNYGTPYRTVPSFPSLVTGGSGARTQTRRKCFHGNDRCDDVFQGICWFQHEAHVPSIATILLRSSLATADQDR